MTAGTRSLPLGNHNAPPTRAQLPFFAPMRNCLLVSVTLSREWISILAGWVIHSSVIQNVVCHLKEQAQARTWKVRLRGENHNQSPSVVLVSWALSSKMSLRGAAEKGIMRQKAVEG